MTFQTAVKTCFAKCTTFSGRATRPEFWWFALLCFSAAAVAGYVTRSFLAFLVLLIPLLSASARRTRDGGHDPIWMGLALFAVFLGLGFVVAGIAPTGGTPPVWPVVAGLSSAIVGILIAGFLLLSPTKHSPNPNEVPQ